MKKYIKKINRSALKGIQFNNSRMVLPVPAWGEAFNHHQCTETITFMLNQIGAAQVIYAHGNTNIVVSVNASNQFVYATELRGYTNVINDLVAETNKIYELSVRYPTFSSITTLGVMQAMVVTINSVPYSVNLGNATMTQNSGSTATLRYEDLATYLGGRKGNTNNRSNITFFQYSLDYVPLTETGLSTTAIRQLQNGGRGSEKFGLLPYSKNLSRRYIFDDTIKQFKCTKSGTLSYFMEGLPYPSMINQKSIKFRDKQVIAGVQLQHNNILKDHIYENGSVALASLNLTGVFQRADSVSTDMPSNWAGRTVALINNWWGGTASTETTDSIITNARCTEFMAHSQYPSGWDNLDYELGANHTNLHVNNARKRRVRFTSKNNEVRTITSLSFFNNDLYQDISTVYNPAHLHSQQIHGYSNPNLTGAIPRPSDNCTDLRLNNCALTGLPLDFNNVGVLHLHANQLQGKVVAIKATTIMLSNGSANQTGTGNIQIDLTNQAVNIPQLYAVNCKVNQVLLPTTTGRTITEFRLDSNASLTSIDFTGITWGLFPEAGNSTFNVAGCGLNQVFPLGTAIRSKTIILAGNGMTSANVNATIDNWLANLANFSANTVVKHLNMGDNNQAVTNDGKLTRIGDTLDAIENGNWVVTINLGAGTKIYYTLSNIRPHDTTTTDIIVTFASNKGYAVNATIYIENTVNYNGQWHVISKGSDVDATNGVGSALYFRLRKTALDIDTTGMAQEKGVYRDA